jgi:outer membrane protein assembly factor BamB
VIKQKTVTIQIIHTAAIGLILSVFCFDAIAGDWPMRLYDKHRGGITTEPLVPTALTERWRYTTSRPPYPAWSESPAKLSLGIGSTPLKPRENFDFCFDVAAVGNFIYFGSSVSGAVYCLNASTGSKVWTFFTNGPVRLAPTVVNGKVYVGSDDGYAYCLNATDGSLVWSVRGGPSDEKFWGNQHMVSVWPVRSSILVDGSDAFWTCGFFPEEGLYLCKRNAIDGTGGWTVTAKRPPQGYLLATSTQLFVPGGKSYPTVYDRSTGAYIGDVKKPLGSDYVYRDGGCWALLTPDEVNFWNGPSQPVSGSDTTQQFRTSDRTYIASVPGANFLIADSTYAYYNTGTQITKILRSNCSVVWNITFAYPYALIMAGNNLFAGGDGEIAAFDMNGVRVWTAPVGGKAYGLAAANGRLFVSTDIGSIHAFSLPSAPPAKATSPDPADSTMSVSITKNLGWTAGSGVGVVSHDVYFGTSSPGTFQGNQAGTTFNPGTMTAYTTYYWRIDERNESGTTTGDVWSFTTAPLPGQASSPNPANNATNIGIAQDLAWTSGSNTTSHNVYFGTANPPAFVGNQTGTMYDTGTMTLNTTYYWRIDEVGPGGTTAGNIWSFTTAAVVAPGKATTPIPANNATSVSTTKTLSWTAGSYATSHNLYFSTTNPPAFIGNQTGTTYNPGTMSLGTKYYWRIDEVGSGGTTTGDVWSFTTTSTAPLPGQASNPDPAAGATGVSTTKTLGWTAGSNVTSHDVYFGTTSPGTYMGNQTGTTYNPGTLAPNTTYYWRIDEKNSSWTVAGNVWSFTTGP